MGTVLEVRKHGSWTVRLMQDEADESNNPRDWDGSFLWFGFPHRHYTFGDEQIDPDRDITLVCPTCGGDGELENADLNKTVDCPACGGSGVEDRPLAWDDVVAHLERTEDALVVRMVSCTDHSGLSFNLGAPRDPWDSGIAGALVFTKKHAEDWGLTDWVEDDIVDQMVAEIGLYDEWASGFVYGYVITDVNGDEVDSCWGYVGDEAIEEAIKEAISCLPDEAPAKLHTVRLTADEVHAIRLALGPGGDEAPDHVIEAITSKLNGALG